MGANDSPTTTRAIITDYFDWRLNNKTNTTNRLFLHVRKTASDCESAYRSQQETSNLHFPSLSSSSPIDSQSLNNIKSIHYEIGKEMFNDGTITWNRIIAFISFSAMFAEHTIQQSSTQLASTLIISSIIDWTTNFIDTEFQTWLQNQNYWAGCQKMCDKTPQRRNSISRYAGILGTIGVLTLGALYMRRT